ncbi:hypothetical protein L218DRAFT_885785 [Marasmius fiardii PR-910]|nr:hypothetical protein L218DRAFT_885785 [Marasmius fiardii PR-910]
MSAWARYDAKWKDILSGNVNGFISSQDAPWPSLKPRRLEREEYEEFVLSPVRIGYEKVFLTERLAQERELWDEVHVANKVVPLFEERVRDNVVRGAKILRGYLDDLAKKYGV